jgi:hypothetical protein
MIKLLTIFVVLFACWNYHCQGSPVPDGHDRWVEEFPLVQNAPHHGDGDGHRYYWSDLGKIILKVISDQIKIIFFKKDLRSGHIKK